MKEQKLIITISIGIGMLSLLIATVFELQIDKFVFSGQTILSGHRAFVIDILLGVFTGALLTVGVSVASFLVKMRSSLFDFWADTEMFSEKAILFASKYFPYGANIKTVISAIERSQTLLDDSYSLRSDYSNIIKLHRDIVFFKKDSEIKSLIDEIINYVGKVNEDVASLCYLQVNSDLTFQQKNKLATVFEPDDCSLQMLIKKCRKLQSRLGVHFKSPDFLDINNS